MVSYSLFFDMVYIIIFVVYLIGLLCFVKLESKGKKDTSIEKPYVDIKGITNSLNK